MTTATAENDLYGSDTEMVGIFTASARELLEQIDGELLQLEQSPENADREMLDRLFRWMHTIKGESGFVSLVNIGKLTHRMEDILDRMRNDEMESTTAVVSSLIAGVGRLEKLVESVETSDEADITADLAALDAVLTGNHETEVQTPPVADNPPAQPAPVKNNPQPTSPPTADGQKKDSSKRDASPEVVQVLIVDDDQMIAAMAARKLKKSGIGADIALSSQDAVAAMQQNLYRVVVCDLHLPDMSGDELIPKLKSISPLTQVIMMTGDANLMTVLRCLEAGALDFIQKSQNYTDLIEQVSRALDRAARWKPLMTSRL